MLSPSSHARRLRSLRYFCNAMSTMGMPAIARRASFNLSPGSASRLEAPHPTHTDPRFTSRRAFRASPTTTNAQSDSDAPTKDTAKKHEIALTPEEKELFDMFATFVKDEKLGTTLRVAGGWVRDKLLGLEGKPDIDFALDNMTGRAFAHALNAWNTKTSGASNLAEAAKTADPATGLPFLSISVIRSNPEQSKHLETATTRLGKFSIDFVQLRSDAYNTSSRVPQIKFGTPLEDALRRDLTINAMFYNVNTGTVEDFTGMGLTDLKKRRVSTPLPALTTLQDDPLRALRAVRFASRFGFDVDEALVAAARDYSVHEALDTKVSRERIYSELRQILLHPAPEVATRAVVMLSQLHLLPIALVLPAHESLLLRHKRWPFEMPPNQQEINRFLETFHLRGVNTLLLETALATAAPTANPHSQYTQELRALQQLAEAIDSSTERSKAPAAVPVDAETVEKDANEVRNKHLVCKRAAALAFAASDWECKSPHRTSRKAQPMEVCEFILSQNLRMSNEYYREVECTVIAARKFRLVLDELIAYNVTHARVEEPAPTGAGATVVDATLVTYRSMHRQTVGLIMREAGPMYIAGIELAVASKLLDSLIGVHTAGQAHTDAHALHIQGIADMLCTTMFGTENGCEAGFHPRNAFGFYENLLSGPNVEGTIGDDVLAAGRDVLHGIHALQLMYDFNAPPLLNGQQLKALFPNLKIGSFFGEVTKEVVRWSAATPKILRTEESLIAHLKIHFAELGGKTE